MKLAIIIPAYNEEARIGTTLSGYTKRFESLRKEKKLDYNILVVINNTKDNTEKIVKSHIKLNSRISYLNLVKGGKGYATIEGFKSALSQDFDLIGFVDADMATSPEAFYYLIEHLGSADGAIANRYSKKSKITPAFSFRTLIVAKVFHTLVRSLFFLPYRDTQCGAKVFNKKATETIVEKVKMSQWAFDVELLYHLYSSGFKIKELPTIWQEVEGSKLDLKKASIQMLFSILQLRVRYSPFRRILQPIKPLSDYIWNKVG
ncbi:hypothetical protein CMI45_00010 [Candidatus Pacearchaeota archaeon]|nr:hypothetical protein [Candidatus Pacearchaeota archaeon]|tara:strand:+ start:7151 stop:7933 length:783 start_codon:yes stop_codon:yes gene_type:complete